MTPQEVLKPALDQVKEVRRKFIIDVLKEKGLDENLINDDKRMRFLANPPWDNEAGYTEFWLDYGTDHMVFIACEVCKVVFVEQKSEGHMFPEPHIKHEMWDEQQKEYL